MVALRIVDEVVVLRIVDEVVVLRFVDEVVTITAFGHCKNVIVPSKQAHTASGSSSRERACVSNTSLPHTLQR